MYLLLIACVGLASPDGESLIEKPAVGADMTPQPPRFKEGLPSFEYTEDGGVYVPPITADALSEMLGYCTVDYPQACAVAVSESARVERVRCDGRLAVQAKQQGCHEIVSEPEGLPWYRVVMIAVGAFVVGAAVGTVLVGVGK